MHNAFTMRFFFHNAYIIYMNYLITYLQVDDIKKHMITFIQITLFSDRKKPAVYYQDGSILILV